MNTWFRSVLFAGAAFAVLAPASQALAQACEFQFGAALGLCTAYCEAMACESGNAQAEPTACAKVLGQWNQKTGVENFGTCDGPSGVTPAAFAECPLSTEVLANDCADSGNGFFVLYDPATPASPPAICACDAGNTQACIDAPDAPIEDACFGPFDRVISTRGANVVGLEGGQTHISTVYCYAIDGIRICQTFTLADF